MGWPYGLVLTILLTGIIFQETFPRQNIWLQRAQAITDDVMSDAPRMARYDRAVLWARLGEAWIKTDPDRGYSWFLKSIELLELSDEDSLTDRLTAARAVVGIVAMHDRKLHNRLMSIIANEKNHDDKQRMENATALAEVGLALIANDPMAAGRFGEASLRLGFSFRLANLLWRLRARDPVIADRLFKQVVQTAVSTRDSNLFSMAVGAAFQGPFSSESDRRLVLSALADVILRVHGPPSEKVARCQLALAPFVPPLLAHYDILLPQVSYEMRASIAHCHSGQATDSAQIVKQPKEQKTPTTVEEFLESARKATNEEQRDHYFKAAAQLAAKEGDFERAIRILDSLNAAGRERLKDSWNTLRWDYATEAACKRLESDSRPAAIGIIEETPLVVRAFVYIGLAKCKAARDDPEVLAFLEAGRNLLLKSSTLEEAIWYLSLVRHYSERKPVEAPVVLSEAIAAINRVSEETLDDDRAEGVSSIMTTQLLLKQYHLPASLLENDEIGVRSALGLIRLPDKRAALRLGLLHGALDQHLSTVKNVRVSKRK